MSRSDAHSRALAARPGRSVPALIAALVMVVVGVLLVWPVVALLSTDQAPGWAYEAGSWLGAQTWAGTWTVAIIVLVALLGLLLIVCAVTPGRPSAVPLADPGSSAAVGATDFVISRRGLARIATAQARLVPGVETVSASVDSGGVRVAVTTYVSDGAQVAAQVTDRVRGAYAQSGVVPVPRVRVSTRTTGVG